MASSGCFTTKDGTRHHIVLGLGVVSVKEAEGSSVKRSTVLGANFDHGVMLGLESSQEVLIKTNANVIIEIETQPWKRINVEQSSSQSP